MTEWRPIPGHLGYEAHASGLIRSHNLTTRSRNGSIRRVVGRTLKPRGPTGRRIHCIVTLRRSAAYVHYLIAITFIGPRPENSLIMHLDDNPLNNAADNLRYGSKSENELAKHRISYIPDDAPF